MHRRAIATSLALVLGPLSASVFSSITVEQIEAEYTNADGSIAYAPIAFNGNSSITLTSGVFSGITFNAVGTSSTALEASGHANEVGAIFYGAGAPAYGSVSQVYADDYQDFFNRSVGALANVGVGTQPGNFSTGVKVVNNSYVTTYGSTASPFLINASDLDAQRRIDTMIYNDNVTFVAAAVSYDGSTNASGQPYYYPLDWSCSNSLAVAGDQQTFNPAGGTGKQHADLFASGQASFTTAVVSSYAAGLYASVQPGQADAMQNVVNRSLLMAGADKNYYLRQTANNLGLTYGAGEANYNTSLAIMQSVERPLLIGASNSVTGSIIAGQSGWSYGTVAAKAQDMVLFNSSNTITSLTASLNWNVYSTESGGLISTTNAYLQFPNLTLQVRSVTYTGGKYVLGANQSNAMLYSIATGDNVQYLYDPNAALPAGNYAFVIGGDTSTSALSASVGFSFVLQGSFASQWNSSAGGSWGNASNWTANVPNGRGAQANFLSSPGITSPSIITLDSFRTVGQINFNNSNGYTIAAGSGGVLNFDDTGDSNFVNPQINVVVGNQTISAPITTASYGLTLTIASAGSLTLSGPFNGSGPLAKSGPGTAYFTNPNAGILVRTLPSSLLIFGGTFSLGAESSSANRQLLVAPSGVSIAGTTGAWTSTLDLNNNDLDIAGETLALVTNQVQEGYNNGKWNGAGGIISTSAAGNTMHLTALGVIQNNQGGTALYTAANPFDGTVPGVNDILVKYTYYGDANLDGKVDGSDYSLIDVAFLADKSNTTAMTGWYNGDFNYDGTVNGSDYTLMDNAYNRQGAVIQDAVSTSQVAGVSAVPEPAMLSLAAFGGLTMLSRRRKHA